GGGRGGGGKGGRRRAGGPDGSPFLFRRQEAFATRFDLMQLVHTRRRCTLPSTTARTRCRLGYQRRFVLLFAWLTLCPVIGPLPQISHTRAMDRSHGRDEHQTS